MQFDGGCGRATVNPGEEGEVDTGVSGGGSEEGGGGIGIGVKEVIEGIDLAFSLGFLVFEFTLDDEEFGDRDGEVGAEGPLVDGGDEREGCECYKD